MYVRRPAAKHNNAMPLTLVLSQALARRFLARLRVLRMITRRWEKIYDPTRRR